MIFLMVLIFVLILSWKTIRCLGEALAPPPSRADYPKCQIPSLSHQAIALFSMEALIHPDHLVLFIQAEAH